MRDSEGVEFLRAVLPRLGLRWAGYRKVRGQVRKRLSRRLKELGLGDLAAYADYLDQHPDEWPVLERMCWISISRFYRDRALFEHLRERILPMLAERALLRKAPVIHCWSAGAALGMEPFSLTILWRLALVERFPDVELRVLATDIDPDMLRRAEARLYAAGALRDLPGGWQELAFAPVGEKFRLRPEFAEPVEFRRHDIRDAPPPGRFDLILCRNLAFTYFDAALQRDVLAKIASRLAAGGFLLLGPHERLPDEAAGFVPEDAQARIYRHTRAPGQSARARS